MLMSELSSKSVVNMNTGKIIGKVIDSEIHIEDGKIVSFLVDKKKMFSFIDWLFPKNYIYLKLSDIYKIGEDVILVQYQE